MKNKVTLKCEYAIIHSVHKGEPVEILVDTEDLEKLKFYRNTISLTQAKSGSMYAYLGWQVQHKPLRTQLTHVILGTPENGYVIDHINRNTLDNRKCNLRFLKEMENHWNVSLGGREQKGNHSSGHLHISYTKHADERVYRVRISRDYKDYHIGYFNTLDEAIKERDIALEKLKNGINPCRQTASGIRYIVKARNGWRFVINKKNEKFSSGLFRTLDEAITFKKDYFKSKEEQIQ